MKSRGLLEDLASMLEPPPVTIPRPGEALAPPRRMGGGWSVGFVFRDDPEALARVNAIRTPAHDAEALERAERKRARVAITRRGLRVVVGPRAAEASS